MAQMEVLDIETGDDTELQLISEPIDYPIPHNCMAIHVGRNICTEIFDLAPEKLQEIVDFIFSKTGVKANV